MRTYAPERLYEEVAYVAYHFHWEHDSIMDMDHFERTRFVEEIARINRRLTEEAEQRAQSAQNQGW